MSKLIQYKVTPFSIEKTEKWSIERGNKFLVEPAACRVSMQSQWDDPIIVCKKGENLYECVSLAEPTTRKEWIRCKDVYNNRTLSGDVLYTTDVEIKDFGI